MTTATKPQDEDYDASCFVVFHVEVEWEKSVEPESAGCSYQWPDQNNFNDQNNFYDQNKFYGKNNFYDQNYFNDQNNLNDHLGDMIVSDKNCMDA